ncbi:MAG: ABC transporter ATP-binding protein [Candidatus Hydrogenedentota bacterium]
MGLTPNAVKLEDVTFIRSGNIILDGLSWTMLSGRHTALLGANGSGKTTLLKIITGYEWPTEGTVEVMGHRLGQCDVRILRRSIGYVSSALEHRIPTEDSAMDVVLSGFEASLGVYREFRTAERTLAEECLKAVGAHSFTERAYGLLSQGEQQRTLIARALIAQPGLLILDEPCAGLDPGARRAFLDDLRRLAAKAEAPNIIYVTHHIEEIGPWLTDVLVLRGGQVLKAGNRSDTLTSDILTEAFGCPCQVRPDGDHFTLAMLRPERSRRTQ